MSLHQINKTGKFFFGLLLAANDMVFLSLTVFLSYYMRFYTGIFSAGKPVYRISDSYIFYSLIFMAAVIFFAIIMRLYSWSNIYKGPLYYLRTAFAPIFGIVSIVIFGLIYENYPFSKLWLIYTIFLSVVLITLSRFFIGIITKKILFRLNIQSDDFISTFSGNIFVLRYLSRIKKQAVYAVLLLISDIVFLGLAFYISYYLRFNTGIMAEVDKTFIIEKNYIFYSVIFILSAVFLFFIYGLYNRDKIYKGSGYYSRLLKAISINIIVIIVAGYLLNLFTFSRKWILLFYICSIVLVFISRALIEAITQKIGKKFSLKSRTIIIGVGENAKRIEDSLKKYSKEEDIIIGHVDKKTRISKDKEYYANFVILGFLENLGDVIIVNNIQRVIISSPEFKYDEILDILERLKGKDVTVLLFPGFFEFSLRRLSVREIGGVPLMQVSNIGFFGFNLFLKNFIDYVLGSIFFVVFIPIYLVVAFMIKVNSKGPVFFKQERMTKDCKVFYMYKFRTMYSDAEKRLKELEQFNEADGPLFKMKNDPRITKTGKFLRKFSIDEIPQIINVLRGELSLVGPRPPLPVEVAKYNDWEIRRMNVKQGITGLWQVSGRSDLSFEEMARLDLYYIQNWSIEMDLKILIKTIPTVLFGKGAY